MRNILVTGISLVLLCGCESDPGAIFGATGGATNSNGNGGSSATNTSSTTAKGGNEAKGGTSSAIGGSVGGTSSSANSASGGATTATGGTRANSSSSATGGSSASSVANTGGKVSTGGTSSNSSSTVATNTGGKATGGGGNVGNGGSPMGGAKPTGGSNSGGGGAGGKSGTTTVATGGAANPAGGSSSVVVTACGLPAAGATGKAKPSGAAGGLKVLDWAGFKSAISYTFDDANSSQINNYAAMNATGGKFTFYLITGKAEASNQVYKTALKDGHEIGNHTSDHTNCTSAASTDAANTAIKSTFGVTAYSFAAPNGATACQSVSSKFLTNRSVAGGSIGAGDTSTFSWLPSDIATASNLAPTAGKWRVICIHGFTGGNDGAYQPIELSSFTSAAKAAVTGGAWVDTVTNVAAYQAGQKAIPATGGNKVSWTLPAIFPTGKCVRVTTTGGTVKQGGTEVPWDDHGYYEISLDAKEVSVE